MTFRPVALVAVTVAAFAADSQLTLQLRDLYAVPITGTPDGRTQDTANLARVNFLREEPGPSRNRFFVNDQNGPLYILDRKTGRFSVYLDFNGRADRKGIFHRFTNNVGYASGLISFQFDPAYPTNGRFYTLHMEDPGVPASPNPDSTTVPGFPSDNYAVTDPVPAPGPTTREVVLVEWTDTNTADTVFQGSAREILRFQLNTQIHPVGDMIFNPTARPGDPDWRVMYIGCGDSGSGESKDLSMRYNPQRLDTLLGKILRIVPDLAEHKDTSKVSGNGRYRVPNDNPFAARAGARPEIWAYGIRNPHRLSWDVDPADRKDNHLFASVIGLHTWETVLLVQKGANYGYSEREGDQTLATPTNALGTIPADDRIPLRIGDKPANELVKPVYPVIQYGHVPEGGDAIAGGFVYRGKIAALRGRFLFGDMTTGHIWWADPKEMIALAGSDSQKRAAFHQVRIEFRPADENGKIELYNALYPIAAAEYHKRGGQADSLPGVAAISKGRADIRFAVDNSGELYILSKSDGMIRQITGATFQ
jgi:hypothetical protein